MNSCIHFFGASQILFSDKIFQLTGSDTWNISCKLQQIIYLFNIPETSISKLLKQVSNI